MDIFDLNKYAIGSKLNNSAASFSPFGRDRLATISTGQHTFYYSLPRLVAVSTVFEFAASVPGVIACWVGE